MPVSTTTHISLPSSPAAKPPDHALRSSPTSAKPRPPPMPPAPPPTPYARAWSTAHPASPPVPDSSPLPDVAAPVAARHVAALALRHPAASNLPFPRHPAAPLQPWPAAIAAAVFPANTDTPSAAPSPAPSPATTLFAQAVAAATAAVARMHAPPLTSEHTAPATPLELLLLGRHAQLPSADNPFPAEMYVRIPQVPAYALAPLHDPKLDYEYELDPKGAKPRPKPHVVLETRRAPVSRKRIPVVERDPFAVVELGRQSKQATAPSLSRRRSTSKTLPLSVPSQGSAASRRNISPSAAPSARPVVLDAGDNDVDDNNNNNNDDANDDANNDANDDDNDGDDITPVVRPRTARANRAALGRGAVSSGTVVLDEDGGVRESDPHRSEHMKTTSGSMLASNEAQREEQEDVDEEVMDLVDDTPVVHDVELPSDLDEGDAQDVAEEPVAESPDQSDGEGVSSVRDSDKGDGEQVDTVRLQTADAPKDVNDLPEVVSVRKGRPAADEPLRLKKLPNMREVQRKMRRAQEPKKALTLVDAVEPLSNTPDTVFSKLVEKKEKSEKKREQALKLREKKKELEARRLEKRRKRGLEKRKKAGKARGGAIVINSDDDEAGAEDDEDEPSKDKGSLSKSRNTADPFTTPNDDEVSVDASVSDGSSPSARRHVKKPRTRENRGDPAEELRDSHRGQRVPFDEDHRFRTEHDYPPRPDDRHAHHYVEHQYPSGFHRGSGADPYNVYHGSHPYPHPPYPAPPYPPPSYPPTPYPPMPYPPYGRPPPISGAPPYYGDPFQSRAPHYPSHPYPPSLPPPSAPRYARDTRYPHDGNYYPHGGYGSAGRHSHDGGSYPRAPPLPPHGGTDYPERERPHPYAGHPYPSDAPRMVRSPERRQQPPPGFSAGTTNRVIEPSADEYKKRREELYDKIGSISRDLRPEHARTIDAFLVGDRNMFETGGITRESLQFLLQRRGPEAFVLQIHSRDGTWEVIKKDLDS